MWRRIILLVAPLSQAFLFITMCDVRAIPPDNLQTQKAQTETKQN
jgi:hypothetical protein